MRHADANLGDVLQQAGAAAGTLLGMLREDDSLAALRLTCTSLRDYVDMNVSRLRLTVTATDRERWAARQLPSLAKFPSCNSVELHLEPAGLGNQDGDLASLTSLPFLGMPLQRRQRITELYLETGQRSRLPARSAWQVEDAICCLASLLPGLRELDLTCLSYMSYDPARQQLMYNNLTALPQLRRLSLPSCRALEAVGALAGGRLEMLIVDAGLCARDGALSPTAAKDGLAKLNGLKHLEFRYCCLSASPGGDADDGAGGAAATSSGAGGGSGGLRLLLDNLPPGLRSLVVVGMEGSDRQSQEFRVELPGSSPYASGVTIRRPAGGSGNGGDTELLEAPVSTFGPLAAVLLGSSVLGPRLGRLEIAARLSVSNLPALALGTPKLRPLWALLQRCDSVRVAEIAADTVEAAVEAVARLGRPGRLLTEGSRQGRMVLDLDALGSAALQVALLRRLAGGCDRSEAEGGAAEGCGRSAGDRSAGLRTATAAPSAATGPLTKPGPSYGPIPEYGGSLIVLRGGLLAALALAPDALQVWVRWLAEQAAALADHPSARRPGGESYAIALAAMARGVSGARAWFGFEGIRPLCAWQALPAAGAIVLWTGTPASMVQAAAGVSSKVAAVAAATATVGQAQPLHQPEQAATGASCAVEAMPLAADVVMAAAAAQDMWPEEGPVRRAFLWALQQELQSRWDASLPGCGGDPAAEAALLRGLLGAWEQLVGEMRGEVLIW
ncbi:hypothetical protein GPECTOR_52g12 [Gonium pectorale]|uniref:Uncharacterized protein n=1 Tax=Gonium pectorale TaxID=33097 RepID=A0A150G6W5_GONPE|nr:hypothetical protein GPECTOR_52g12 [Gonium pectorale]|eukprot:KXZ45609.1 hypothetical protein GPECTOR_52g12 [Gonium pectorale]